MWTDDEQEMDTKWTFAAATLYALTVITSTGKKISFVNIWFYGLLRLLLLEISFLIRAILNQIKSKQHHQPVLLNEEQLIMQDIDHKTNLYVSRKLTSGGSFQIPILSRSGHQ